MVFFVLLYFFILYISLYYFMIVVFGKYYEECKIYEIYEMYIKFLYYVFEFILNVNYFIRNIWLMYV